MIKKLLFFTGFFVLLGAGIQGHADTSDKTQETGTVTYALTANYLKADMSSDMINEIHDIAPELHRSRPNDSGQEDQSVVVKKSLFIKAWIATFDDIYLGC